MLSLMTALNLHAQLMDAGEEFPSAESALEYIRKIIDTGSAWKQEDDTTRYALQRLAEQTAMPYDTIRDRFPKIRHGYFNPPK